MPVRRKELPSSFWQRLWRSRLNLALGPSFWQRLWRSRLNLALRPSFRQRLWRSRLNLALGRLYVQTHRWWQRRRLNLRLGSALDRGVPSVSRGSLNFPQRHKCKRWRVDFRLRWERNVNRSIGTPKDEIAGKHPSDRTRTQEFNAIGEWWPTQHSSGPTPVRLKRDRASNRSWRLGQR